MPPETAKFESVFASLIKDHLEKDAAAVNTTDSLGRTPLHLEALYGRKHSVKVLLDYGANVTKKCARGWTPRDYAEKLKWTEVLQLIDKAYEK